MKPNKFEPTQDLLKTLLGGMQAAAYIIDQETFKLVYVNAYLKNIFLDAQEGSICYEALWGYSAPCQNCPMIHAKEQEKVHFERFECKSQRYLSIDAIKLMGAYKNQYVFTGYDITDRVLSEQKLHQLAYYNERFGIKNMKLFLQDSNILVHQTPNAISYLIRLKNIAQFNMILGRENVDRLIHHIIACYESVIDKSNIYYMEDAIIGFLIPDAETLEQIRSVTNKINLGTCDSLKGSFNVKIDTVELPLSTEPNYYQKTMHYIESLFNSMEDQKEAGSTLLTETHIQNIERRNKIRTLIEQEIKPEDFKIYLQPVYSIQEQRYTKCEALSRLYTEQLGWVSPLEFIPVLEETGKVKELTFSILRTACKMIQSRKERGKPAVYINVNIPPLLLPTQEFHKECENLHQQYGDCLQYIKMELTENIAIKEFEHIKESMERLIALGVSFSIDDFGSGYSNLNYLVELQATEVKADKCLIDKIHTSSSHRLMIENIIKLSHALNFEVVAEGVEVQEQYEILKDLGCDYIQGYYFSKPIDSAEIESVLP